MSRCAVTGGSGFIGSYLVDELARRGFTVTVLDNLRRPCTSFRPGSPQVSFNSFDIRVREGLAEAIRGCDAVFHLAAEATVMGAVANPAYTIETNVMGTFNVLQAAKAAGVKRVVFASSREVYGAARHFPVPEHAPINPINSYGVSKAAAELYCRAAAGEGMETVILRLANVYGHRDHGRVIPLFVDAAIEGRPIQVFDPEKVVDFIWIGTVVKAMIAAGYGSWLREPINLGSGKGVKLVDVAQRIVALCQSTSDVRTVDARPAEVNRFVADIGRAQNLLDIEVPDDPLSHLPEVVSFRSANKVATSGALA